MSVCKLAADFFSVLWMLNVMHLLFQIVDFSHVAVQVDEDLRLVDLRLGEGDVGNLVLQKVLFCNLTLCNLDSSRLLHPLVLLGSR